MKYGLANVPFWAFPLTDGGWKELDERPLFRACQMFSNNAPDSRYFPLYERKDGATVESENAEKARYILARLRERGKTYRVTLIDRNFLWGVETGRLDRHDNLIREDLLLGIKVGVPSTWAWCLNAAPRLIATLYNAEYMVWNGAEGKDSVESYHFSWDLRGTRQAEQSRRMADAFEEILSPLAIVADFRHRYWARNPDGALYYHYHRTLPYEGFKGEVTRIYQETGVHANLGDTVYWLERQRNVFKRFADEWWWHGVIDVNSEEKNPVDAWSHETLSRLQYPPARRDYHGLLAEPGVEEWLVERMTVGIEAR